MSEIRIGGGMEGWDTHEEVEHGEEFAWGHEHVVAEPAIKC